VRVKNDDSASVSYNGRTKKVTHGCWERTRKGCDTEMVATK